MPSFTSNPLSFETGQYIPGVGFVSAAALNQAVNSRSAAGQAAAFQAPGAVTAPASGGLTDHAIAIPGTVAAPKTTSSKTGASTIPAIPNATKTGASTIPAAPDVGTVATGAQPVAAGPTAASVIAGDPTANKAGIAQTAVQQMIAQNSAYLQKQAGPATPSQQFQLAQLQPADPTKGYGTPYYGAYTNDGGLAATLYAAPGARVQLIDPSNGQVVAEGVGQDGAQQIATLANAISQSEGKKASWDIKQETGAGTNDFQTFGGDRVDKPRFTLLNALIDVGAPLLGAMIPGLAPFIGAALGGLGGSLVQGKSLTQSLLTAATAGLGNSFGGALSGALTGAPISFAGTNALGSLAHSISGGLSGLTSGAGSAAGSQIGSQIGSGALSGLTSGAADAGLQGLANTVAPVVVNGVAGGGLGSAIGGALGTALGGIGGSALTGIGSGSTPGTTSAGQPGGTQSPVTNTGVNEVAPVTVTAPSGGGALAAAGGGVGGAAGGLAPTISDQAPTQSGNGGSSQNSLQNHALDITGQTVGNVGATLGVYGLAQLLGLLPSANDSSGGSATSPGNVSDGTSPSGPIAGTPGGFGGGGTGGTNPGGPTSPTPGPITNPVGTGTPGTSTPTLGALSTLFNAGKGGNGAPLAAAPSLDVQGSMAPDIYPWRKPQMGALA